MDSKTYYLDQIEHFLQNEEKRVAVVCGRKGLGKTMLVKEALQGKRALWVEGYATTGDQEVSLLTRAVAHQVGRATVDLTNIRTLEDFLKAVCAYSVDSTVDDELTFVIDRYEIFAASESSYNIELASAVSGILQAAGVKLILILDSRLQYEKLFFGKKSPWNTHIIEEIDVKPLPFAESRKYAEQLSTDDQMKYYGMTGGIPSLLRMTEGMSLQKTFETVYISHQGQYYLAENVMSDDLRELSYYNRMLYELANDVQRVNAISEAVGKPKDVVVPYMNTLMSLGLVKKETPVTEKTNRKKTRYSIVNTADKFWYQYVISNHYLWSQGNTDDIWSRIQSEDTSFMKTVFVQICKEYLASEKLTERLGCTLSEIGNWWENDEEKKTSTGFDLVGLGPKSDRPVTVYCRCYYGEQPVEISELKSLIELTKHTKQEGDSIYVVFSKAGFHENAITVASAIKNIVLLGMDELEA